MSSAISVHIQGILGARRLWDRFIASISGTEGLMRPVVEAHIVEGIGCVGKAIGEALHDDISKPILAVIRTGLLADWY